MDTNRIDLLPFYVISAVLGILLLLDYTLSHNIKNKLDKMEQNSRKSEGIVDERLAKIQKCLDFLDKKFATLREKKRSIKNENRDWNKQWLSFSLTPDPYFQNLFKGTKSSQNIVVGISADEKGFNRILENSAQIVEWHDHYVNDVLARRHWENPNKWAPHLAERIETSPDNREFKIYLRKGVLWHRPLVDWASADYNWLKGEHYVTSDDFYFAYTTIMNPQIKGHHLQSAYDQIESFTIIDDYTYSVRWKKTLYTNLVYTLDQFPLPHFIYAYGKNGDHLPADKFAENFNNHWYNEKMLGCGPYVFSQHQTGEYVEFIRNEDYYGYRPAIKCVRFVVEKDSNVAFEMLKKGQIDVIPQLPEHIYQRYLKNADSQKPVDKGHFVIQVYPRSVYYHIKWNNIHPIFQDSEVRKAMTYAFDRQRALKELFIGLGTIATSGIPPGSTYYNNNIKPYPYDLRKAQRILKERGWRDENGDGILEKFIDGEKVDFDFTLYYASKDGANHRKMYYRYKKALNKIGVHMTPEAIDWPDMIKRYENKNFAAIRGAWLTDIPLVDFYQIWHSRYADEASSSNHIHFKNTEVDMICQKMREATALEERLRLAHRMQEIMHEKQPYTFLFFVKGVAAFNSNVKNRFIRKFRPYVLIHPFYID